MGGTVVTTGPDRERRQRRLAALLAAPAVAAALGLCALEGWRMLRPRSPLFAPPFAYSLAEAIATGNVLHGYEYIRAGQDPNEPIAVRDRVLTGDRWILTSPLVWAIAVGNVDAVKMLLGHGARLDPHAEGRAICLAAALEHTDMARLLSAHGDAPTPADCADVAARLDQH
jgi:hypothetical protein